jgi:hypothetical protein
MIASEGVRRTCPRESRTSHGSLAVHSIPPCCKNNGTRNKDGMEVSLLRELAYSNFEPKTVIDLFDFNGKLLAEKLSQSSETKSDFPSCPEAACLARNAK